MSRAPRWSVLLIAPLLQLLPGQTTQGMIAGRITDQRRQHGIVSTVHCENLGTHAIVTAPTDALGYYVFPLLPPGLYSLTVKAPQYQNAIRYDLELPVAGLLEQNFAMRPLFEVWESADTYHALLPQSGRTLTAYGPDVAATQTPVIPAFSPETGVKGELEASVSYVVQPELIEHLPLAGRDAYALLTVQPGVAADTATSRGLGLTVTGQRPSASNFLLDGLEANNYVTTGPAVPIAPEAIQEYRISTANLSAEYGRTSGFLANAVTRAGNNTWHGLLYYDFRNQHLNANGFQQNAQGHSRPYEHETQPGFWIGGPLLRNRLFFSLAAESDSYRSELDPQTVLLPTTSLRTLAPPGSDARLLMDLFPPAQDGGRLLQPTQVRQPTENTRRTGLARLDWLEGSSHRLMSRLLIAGQRRPDFDWSPFPGFTTPLTDTAVAPAFLWTWNIGPHSVNEIRAGYTADNLGFDRAHPEVPRLTSNDQAVLPSSPLVFSYRSHSHTTQLIDDWTRLAGRHILKLGGAILWRQLAGYLAPLSAGQFTFSSASAFAAGAPSSYTTLLLRVSAQPALPDYTRRYNYRQYFLYLQDSVRAGRRLTIEYGVRYENFGAPRNTGQVKDDLIGLGAGADTAARLRTAAFQPRPRGDQALFETDSLDFAARTGFSWSLRDDGRTLLHGGYGIFYDRPFDNLWLTVSNNSVVTASSNSAGGVKLLDPPATIARQLRLTVNPGFPAPTIFQPAFRNGRVQEIFAGLEHHQTPAITLEVIGQASIGRRLTTTDLVNRALVPPNRLNPGLPEMSYRAAEGGSDYAGMTAVVRYRSSPFLLQASYTWSHALDNQSEPLTGDFFALDFFGPAASGSSVAFTEQFHPAADRASSSFDQRQNLVILSSWQPPIPVSGKGWDRLLRDWRASTVAAFRSGFPYSVTAPNAFSLTGQDYRNNPADLVGPDLLSSTGGPYGYGGQRLLNPAAFAVPAAGHRGNLGRNAFRGPGLYSVDFSLSRTLALPKLQERWRLTLRADAYNLLNHANLGNPCGLLTATCAGTPFGVALYGRQGTNPGYPALTPLNESPRKIQILVRLAF